MPAPTTDGDSAPDPWKTPDPALTIALKQLGWYAKNRDQNRNRHEISEVLLLLVTAATTVAAALGAVRWVTASLAASAIVLTGLRKIFDWHHNWIAFAIAWADVGTAVNDYRLLPVDQRDHVTQRRLLHRIDEIVAAETASWASRRREATQDHDAQ